MPVESVRLVPRGGGLALAGSFVAAAAATSAIVFVHGKDCSRGSELKTSTHALVRALRDRGFAVLMLDLRGHGESAAARMSYGLHERHDVLGAVDWLIARGFAPQRIGLFGASMGGACAIGALAHDPQLVGPLVLDSSFADFDEMMRRNFSRLSGMPRWLLLRINSYGGDVFDGLAIYNALVRHPAAITTHVDGIAASIASVIAMAGTDIRIAESGWLMIHDAWGMSIGNAADMRSMADKLEATSTSIANIYAARTGNDESTIKTWMAEERWFDSAEAVEKGWANGIAENLRMAARAVPERFAFRHAPDAIRGAAGAQQTLQQRSADDVAVRAMHRLINERVRRAAALRQTRAGASK